MTLSRNARESIKMEGSEMVTVVQSKDIQNKCEKKSINKSHLTRHLDCPSAPLGEVEPVCLCLVLGDLLGLVLKIPGGRIFGLCREPDRSRTEACILPQICHGGWLVLINMHTALLLHHLREVQPFRRKG